MRFEWTNQLSEQQHKEMLSLYDQSSGIHFEQYPGWNTIEKNRQPVRYCLAYVDGGLIAYVALIEVLPIEIRVLFGPVYSQVEAIPSLVSEVVRYYRGKKALQLKWLLGMENSHTSLELQYRIQRAAPFRVFYNQHNKGSLRFYLEGKSDEELLGGFSSHHKRAVRKGKTAGLTCKMLDRADDIALFAHGYEKMLRNRKLASGYADALASFTSIHQWLEKNNPGFFLGVFKEEEMTGGMLMIGRGDHIEYYKGFALPGDQQLPINHYGFYEAMRIARDQGYRYFDLGGYNILVKEGDQVVAINRFKLGFNPHPFFYPMTMYFNLKPAGTALTKMLLQLKKIFTGK